MQVLRCNACNKGFEGVEEQKLHYSSEWHRYNLKRKVAGVPGVTEALFLARKSALAQEKKKADEVPMLYSCGLCGKSYKSSKAHAEHLKSKSHLSRTSQGGGVQEESSVTVRPLPRRVGKDAVDKPLQNKILDSEESEESEWEEIDPDEDLVGEAADSLTQLKVDEQNSESTMDDEEDEVLEDLDASCCFMCDLKHETIEDCMVHMHKQHGFFIPDVEYLKDPTGLLTYLGLKVKRDFLCLYCNYRCHPFGSLEAVRKHMVAKSHCKLRYGDGDDDDEEAELEDFYDYSSSYPDAVGNQLVALMDTQNTVELGSGGAELVIRKRTNDRVSTKILGSREFLRYYRQKPRPTTANDIVLRAALTSRYRSMGLVSVQPRENIVRMKVLKAANRSGVEAMRTKIGMKSNVIRNLPKNVPY